MVKKILRRWLGNRYLFGLILKIMLLTVKFTMGISHKIFKINFYVQLNKNIFLYICFKEEFTKRIIKDNHSETRDKNVYHKRFKLQENIL